MSEQSDHDSIIEFRGQIDGLRRDQDETRAFLWPPDGSETLRELIRRKSTEAENKISTLESKISQMWILGIILFSLAGLGVAVLQLMKEG